MLRKVREEKDLTGRREERLQALSSELSPLTDVHYSVLDVRDSEAVVEFANNLPERFKQVAILVNNAGLALGAESADKAH